jgi:hypothetical protein
MRSNGSFTALSSSLAILFLSSSLCIFLGLALQLMFGRLPVYFFERFLILLSLGFHWVAFRPFTHYASRFLVLLFGLIALQIGPSILVSNFLFLKKRKEERGKKKWQIEMFSVESDILAVIIFLKYFLFKNILK